MATIDQRTLADGRTRAVYHRDLHIHLLPPFRKFILRDKRPAHTQGRMGPRQREAGWPVEVTGILDSWMHDITQVDRHVFIVTYGCHVGSEAPVVVSGAQGIGPVQQGRVKPKLTGVHRTESTSGGKQRSPFSATEQ